MVKCIRVPKKDAERVRQQLISQGSLDIMFRIESDGEHVLIPISERSAYDRTEYDVTEADLTKIENKETDYRKLADIDEDMKDILPTSFDIIGDIAIIKLPDPLIPFKNAIGEAVMLSSGKRMVMMDSGVKGELRIRHLEIIAGMGPTETEHKEFGVRMFVDPSKVYFNPRLATERMRIASLVKEGETIIDMFAGVAPFPLVIAKHSKPSVIYAIDLNKETKEFMERNVSINKITNIIVMNDDVRNVTDKLPKADRVIMNLPQSAFDFFPEALELTKDGGTIHMHRVQDEPDAGGIIKRAKELGRVVTVERVIELKSYSPSSAVYVYDIKVIS